MPKQAKFCIGLVPVNSKAQAHKPAPVQAPKIVPKKGMGIRRVPSTAPVMAPMMAPSEPRQPAPAFLAPPIPEKNSINSPARARAVMASKV